jgi:hypothetical protein
MHLLTTTQPDVWQCNPSLVLLLFDGFTRTSALAGDVVVEIGNVKPFFENPPARFVFGNLSNGDYVINVQSAPDEPYYLPVNIPIALPFPRPADSLWQEAKPVWPAFPDIVLADPSKMLQDPAQTAPYLGQRALATLIPTTAYPFPAGATLVRGSVTASGSPLSSALVTTEPAAMPGQIEVAVFTPAGVTSAVQVLTVVSVPVINSLDPAAITAGAPDFVMIVEGSGFVMGAVVKWNGVALPTTSFGRMALAAKVTTAQVGKLGQTTIVVTNPDGTTSNQQTFTVAPAPTLTSIDPPSISAGVSAFGLDVYGNGFAQAAAVQLNGTALPTTWLNSTHLTAEIAAPQVTTVAQLNIVAVNPGPPQQISNPKTLSVANAPVINSLEPAAVVAQAAAFTLTVKGSGFASGAIVELNGNALPSQVLGSSQLTAQISASQVAAVAQLNITVVNPNGAISNLQTLGVIAAPAITSINPATVAADIAAFPLIVRGSGFVSGCVVELNGIPLSTSFVDSTELDAHVPRSGYTTGNDGTFVLYFDSIGGQSQIVSLTVSHSSFQKPKSIDVTALRGATVSVNVDMTL